MNYSRDQYIIDGILREDGKILRQIYAEYFPGVIKYLCKSGGTEEDAKDIFQDAIIVVFLKAKKDPYFLKASFNSFISKVCRYLWMKHLRDASLDRNSYSLKDYSIPSLDNSVLEEMAYMEKQKLVWKHFEELGPECQTLLTLLIEKTPIEVVVQKMGYSSIQYARNRKLNCKNLLVRKIWHSPEYKELRNEKVREDTAIPRW